MKHPIDKHLVAAFCICIVITATIAFSVVLLKKPTPPAEAATQSMIAQPIAEGSSTGWVGYPNPSWGYVNIDETLTCNSSDYNFAVTPAPLHTNSSTGTETYRTSLSTIPNSTTTTANDGTGDTIQTTYRIVKVEVTPCFALHLPAPKSSNVDVFYRFATSTATALWESAPKNYTITSNLFKQQAAATWTASFPKNSDSILEVGVRYTGGNGGVRVSQLKVKVTYEALTKNVSGWQVATLNSKPIITKQPIASNELTNGDKNLSTFQIVSDDGGTVYIKQLVFKISKNSGVTLSNFRVRKGNTDMPVAKYSLMYATTTGRTSRLGSGSIGSASGTSYLVVSFKNDEAVGGSGTVYTLHAAVSGASTGRYVTTSFYAKKGVPPPDADNGAVPPPDADYGTVPPPDADTNAIGGFLWAETLHVR